MRFIIIIIIIYKLHLTQKLRVLPALKVLFQTITSTAVSV